MDLVLAAVAAVATFTQATLAIHDAGYSRGLTGEPLWTPRVVAEVGSWVALFFVSVALVVGQVS